MADLTAIILTRDEEKNIAQCISSISGFASRILVIDCGSNDRTREIAEDMGAEVMVHPFSYYAQQFNYGIDNGDITTRWTLRLDADERFTPAVRKHCERLMEEHAEDDVNGIVMEADFYFMGRLMKHGATKKRKIMIFKTGFGRIEDRKRDAHTILHSGRTVAIPERYLHDDFKDLYTYIGRYNWYATRELHDYVEYCSGRSQDVNTDERLRRQRKKKYGLYYKAPMFLRAFLLFYYNYYFKLGFLDGREGYIYNFFESYWYRFLIDARIFEYEKNREELDELKAYGD